MITRHRPLMITALMSTVAATGLFAKEPDTMTTRHATGTFNVKMQPPDNAPASGTFVRLRGDKVFDGAMEGTSASEMLATNGGDQPSGGYVALERFTGTLDGRTGSFIMQHSGTMSPKGMHMDVQVTPGSGTGELAGIEGRLTIRIEGKQHFYDLEYTLP